MKLAWKALSLPIVTVVAIVFIPHSAGASAESAPVKSTAERQIWQSDGYGYIFDISGDSVDMYNSTRDSLVPFGKGHIESDGSLYLDEILAATHGGQTFWLGRFIDGVMTDHLGYVKTFHRLDHLPAAEYDKLTDDPVHNFEVFWQTYEENFSFFPVINLDWHDVYREYRPKVNPGTTDEELQGIFRAMIRRLNDGHSNLFSGDDVFSSHSEGPREAFFQRSRNVIEGNVHDRYIEGGLTTKLDGRVQYGRTRSGEGYIKLLEFDVSDPDDVDQALGDMVRDLERCRTFIVDMRFNRGGEDFFGTKVAGLFADERKVAYRKQVRTGGYGEFSEPVSIYIEPAAKRFAADRVVILTSPLTVSAGETATLALKELDNAVTVGEQTAGFFSDMLLKSLPNRQLFSMSNERYTSVGGVNFEQLGLPPDEQITTTQADVAALRDPVMDRALELSKQAP